MSISCLVLGASSSASCLVYDSSLLDDLSDPEGSGGSVKATGGEDAGGSGGSDDAGGTNSGGNDGSGGDSGQGSGSAPGSGSTTGAGGTSGSGGAQPLSNESLVDDFDDMNAAIENEAGRTGTWMAVNDGSPGGVMSPGPGDPFVVALREDTNFALHIMATGFESWGVGYFASLSEGTGTAGMPGPYDLLAEGYNAVRFWAKKEPGKASLLKIRIADESSSPSGSCPVAPEEVCGYDHAEGLVSLQDEWTEFTLRFEDLSKNLSSTIEFDKAYEIHIVQPGADVDFWIDDIRFVELPLE